MANPRQIGFGTAKRRVRWSLAFCAATILLLVSPGVEPQRIAAQAQSIIDGTLEVQYEDSYDGARLTHYVNTGTERIALRFTGSLPGRLLTGARVRARGARRNGTLLLATGADVSSLSADGSTISSDETSPSMLQLASPNTFGAQSTLVILFNFQDLTTQPYSPASAQAVTFNEVSNFYLENSFGQTWLEGTVAGWYTIAASSTACNYNTWAAQAEQAAIDAGVNVASYPRRVFGFPQTAACSWWGLGTVGGGTVAAPSRAWINGTYSLRVLGHEMGHNLGLSHSRSSTCDSSGCVVDEYGDDHDIMGAVTGHFNAFQKERLGWLGYGTSPSIQAVTETGQYPLEPYATANGGLPKALRIFKSTVGSSNTYIYAEARTQSGSDASLTPGVVIHTGVDTDGTQIYLHDLVPSTSTIDFLLDPGQSFTFSDGGPPVTLTALAFDTTGALLDVTVPCAYTLTSPGQAFVSAGGPGSVGLTIGSSCDWSAASHDSWITLDPGSTSGTGPSTIAFTVGANSSASIRTGTLTIGDETFTVTQAGLSCGYAVSPASASFDYTGGSGTVSVTTSGGCGWPATSNASWITITSGASGTGSGIATYVLASNSASHTSRTGTLTIAGQTVTITQEGLAALFLVPANGSTTVANPSLLFTWTFVSSAQRYQLTVGTTPGGAEVWDTGEIAQASQTVNNLPPSTLLYARVRTKFTGPITWTQSDISFRTVDHVSSVQVLGAQTPSPVVAGQSTQYGASAATSVKIAFTGAGGGCTATLSATGLPAGASATFTPSSVTSSASNQFTLLTIATTTATPPGSHTVTVRAQANSACGSGFATTTIPLIVGSSFMATTLSPAAANGIYGGASTVSATLTASGSPVSGKTVAFTLNGSAAGTAVTNASGVATLATASLGGMGAGSYPAGVGAAFAGDAGAGASSGTSLLTVSPKAVTPTVAAASKVYDGTLSATLTSCTVSGLVGGDVVACTGTAAFATASVGTGKLVTASGLTLTGAAAGNYALSTTTATTSAAITARLVTPAVAVADKVYDGTTSATLTSCTVSGLVGGDVVTCTGTAAFATASVGTGKPVTVSGLTLTGAAAGNYALSTTTATTTATITAAPIPPSLVAAYAFGEGTGTTVTDSSGSGHTGTTSATWTAAGKYGSALSFNGSTARVDIPNTSALQLTTAMTVEAWVNPSTVTSAWRDVVYKGDDTYYLSAMSPTGAQPVAGGIVGASHLEAVGPAALGVNTWTHLAMTYDGVTLRLYVNGTLVTSAARTGTLTMSTQPLQIGGNGIYGQYFAGLIDEVRVYRVALTAGQIQADMATPIGAVGPVADLTVTKTHAGGFTQGQIGATYAVTVTNAGTGATSGAVTVGDTLPGGLTATALAGPGWSCTLGTLTCTRSDALAAGTSYPAVTVTVTVAGTAPASVTNQATVSGGGESNPANNSASDPTAVASSGPTATTLAAAAASGIYGGAVTLSATLTASGSPVSGKPVAFTLNGSAVGTAVTNASGVATLATASLGGIGAGSHPTGVGASFAGDASYGASSGTGALTVSPKAVTPTVAAVSKVYDGTLSATLTSCTVSGLVGADVVSCTGSAAFATASVGTGKPVTATGLALTGTAAGNYALSTTTATTTAAITAALVTPTVAAATKAYDGTLSATLTSCTVSGLVGGDVVACTGTAAFATASVGTGKPVTATGLALTGTAAGNYALSTTTAATTAAITARLVTPAVAVADKVYDGTTSATLTSCTVSGLVGGDVVTCTGTAAFATASVGTGKPVTVSGLTLTGAAAGNYALSTTTATTTATITAAPIPPSLVAAYAFGEGTGTTVTDSSGSGHTGTTSATWTAAGKYGSALSFNGSTARVDIPNTSALQLTTAMTVEAWVNPSTVTSAWRDVVYKGDDTYYLSAMSPTGAQPVAGGIVGASHLEAVGPTALGVNTWTHLAMTYDGATLRLYVNGTLVTSAARTGTLTMSTQPLQIGGNGIYGQYFAGLIDEVRVYRVALTAGQIQADMATPIGAVGPAPDLTVTKTHAGGFTQGQIGATYAVTVTNAGTGATSGAVTVGDTLPGGLTATALAGPGWSCTLGTLTCTRSDALAAGTSYPAVTVTVTVAGTAPASVTNQATVSGGGESNPANNSASDPTAVASSGPTATTLAAAAASGIYGGAVTLSATLTASGSPVSGKPVAFTLNGSAVGTAVTNASGVATLATASLGGIGAGSYPAGVGAAFAGDAGAGASSGTNALTVSPKAVTPTVAVASKVYDGVLSTTLTSCTVSGLVGGDVVACTGTAAFATASVGTAKPVTASGLTLTGTAAGNYALSTTTAATTAAITARLVTPAVAVADKVYDGTTSATLTSCTVSVVIGGDVVACTGTAAFATASVGTVKPVTVSGLTLTGAAAGNYALSTTTATTTATITAAPIPPSLVAAYAFGEGTGTAVTDSSGSGHTGTTSATWTAAGKYGSALSFNGSTARVDIPNTSALQLTTAMTVEAWVNPSTVTSAWRDVVYKGDDNYYLSATSPTGAQPVAGGVVGASHLEAVGPTALGVNTWTHLAMTYDGATLRLYVNGTLVTSAARTGTLTTSTNPLQIGGNGIYGQYFAGLIDDVRVYRVALTAAQIQTDMNTPIGTLP